MRPAVWRGALVAIPDVTLIHVHLVVEIDRTHERVALAEDREMAELPIVVLAFANEQEGRNYLRNLPEELRRLHDILKDAQDNGLCRVEVLSNATLDQIFDVFTRNRDKIAVLHYAGHADSGRLLLESNVASGAAAHAAGLATFLGQCAGLQLVFLNGCSTRAQVARLIEAGVASVIATSRAIDDGMARQFAIAFYTELAAGLPLRAAYEKARGRILAAHDTVPEAYYGHRDLGAAFEAASPNPTDDHGFPWEFRPGTELVERWSLPDAADNPEFGLPRLPEGDLPESPFRHLNWFTAEHAEVFFGRGYQIRELYEQVTDPTGPPILLLYGASGVGKSSLLDAGLVPRLESGGKSVRYCRRDQQKGLLGSLVEALRSADRPTVLGEAWRAEEARLGKPLIVFLDQVEEVFTRADTAPPRELEDFLAALVVALGNREARPRGKLVLGFRKEWLAELDRRLKETNLRRTQVFLKPLDRRGIIGAIRGPARPGRLQRQYRLSIEDGLPEVIADNLLADAGSALSSTLQVLLAKMWERARLANPDQPSFDRALYESLKAEGYLLKDVLDEGLKAVGRWNPAVEDSGLALDVLAYHTTDLGTAAQRTRAELDERYAHQAEALDGLLARSKDSYLLVDAEPNLQSPARSTRLAHDLLAPLVQHRFRLSMAPGQRARRLLENRAPEWKDGKAGAVFDETDLATVEAGISGMRAWDPDESHTGETGLVEASRRVRRRLRRTRRFLAAMAVTLIVAVCVTGVFAWVQWGIADDRTTDAKKAAAKEAVEAKIAKTESERAWRTLGNADLVSGASAREVDSDPILATHYFLRARSSFAQSTDQVRYRNASLAAQGLDPLVALTIPHSGRVLGVQFSRDRSHVITWSDDDEGDGGMVVVWNWRTGAVRHTQTFPTPLLQAWCSDEGIRYATLDNVGTITIRNSATGDQIRVPLELGPLSARWVVDDLTCIVTLDNNGLSKVWANGTVSRTQINTKDCDVSFHKDRPLILVIPKDRSKPSSLWDLVARRPKREFKQVANAVFDDQGRSRILVWDNGGSAGLWEIGTAEVGLVVELSHGSPIAGAKFAPGGNALLTWSNSGSSSVAKLWDISRRLRIVPAQEYKRSGTIRDAIVSRTGTQVLAWGNGGEVWLWNKSDPTRDIQFLSLANSNDRPPSIGGAAFCCDDKRIATWTDSDTRVHVWDIPTNSATLKRPWLVLKHQQVTRTYRPASTRAIAPDGDSRILTLGTDGAARLWDLSGGAAVRLAAESKSKIVDATVARSARYIGAWDVGGTAWVWHLEGNNPVPVPIRQGSSVKRLAFTEQDRLIAWSADGSATTWKIGSSEPPAPVHADQKHGTLLAGTEEYVVTSSADGQVTVLDSQSGSLIGTIRHVGKSGAASAPKSATVSRNAAVLLTCGNDDVTRLWRLTDGALLHSVAHSASKNGTRLVGGSLNSDGTRAVSWVLDVLCWAPGDPDRNTVLRHDRAFGPAGNDLPPLGAVFTGTGERVLTWHWDGFARLWSFADGNLVRSFKQESLYIDGIPINCAISKDESLLMTASPSFSSEPARLWDVESGRVLREFRAYGGTFSADGQYLLTFGDGGIDMINLSIDASSREDAEIADFQIRSATELTSRGEFRMLTAPEWLRRQNKMGATHVDP